MSFIKHSGVIQMNCFRGVSHSALSTMEVIEQETPDSGHKSSFDRYSSRNRDNDMDDDFEMIGGFSSGPPK